MIIQNPFYGVLSLKNEKFPTAILFFPTRVYLIEKLEEKKSRQTSTKIYEEVHTFLKYIFTGILFVVLTGAIFDSFKITQNILNFIF